MSIHAKESQTPSVGVASGSFAASGRSTVSAWQHSACGDRSVGALTGGWLSFLQHSCCTAAVCAAFSICPRTHRCDSTTHPSSIATISEMRRVWLLRIEFKALFQ